MRRSRAGIAPGDLSKIEVVENPAGLSEGSVFRLQGREWVVADREGVKEAVSEDGRESFNLDGVAALPIDARSLRRDAGMPVPERADILDEIPFALRDARTEFDTEAIIETRARAASIESTHTIDTPSRRRLRRRIAKSLYGNGAPVKGREAVLILGPPAAGKSNAVANPVVESIGGLIVDSDMAKELLPEFDKGVGAGAVHLESDGIASLVLQKAIEKGDNLVLPRVGKGLGSMQQLRDLLVGAGYRVHLIDLRLDPAKAAQRAVSRFEETGRFVDPDYVFNIVGNKPTVVNNALKKGGGFESYSAYSNNVERGQRPILIERHGNAPSIPAQNLDRPGGRPQGGGLGLPGGRGRPDTGRGPGGELGGPQGASPEVDAGPFALREPELPGMTPAQTRITPEGRPDLANPGQTEPVRGFVSAVDELRNRAGQPERTTIDAIEQAAARRMARDYDGEVYRTKQKVQRGEAPTADSRPMLRPCCRAGW